MSRMPEHFHFALVVVGVGDVPGVVVDGTPLVRFLAAQGEQDLWELMGPIRGRGSAGGLTVRPGPGFYIWLGGFRDDYNQALSNDTEEADTVGMSAWGTWHVAHIKTVTDWVVFGARQSMLALADRPGPIQLPEHLVG